MHLNTDQLVDIAEGTRSESTAPHLAGCEPCRAQLRDLRAMMAATRGVDVPEPSPLFWDHLSARIREAVADDARLKPSRDVVPAWMRAGWFQASVVVAAAVLLVVAVSLRAPAPAAPGAPSAAIGEAAPAIELLDDTMADGDASLTLVASLTDGLDLDGAREAGLTPRGSAEHAVTHMSAGELRELGRLLKEAMQ